mgnify:CR=1
MSKSKKAPKFKTVLGWGVSEHIEFEKNLEEGIEYAIKVCVSLL